MLLPSLKIKGKRKFLVAAKSILVVSVITVVENTMRKIFTALEMEGAKYIFRGIN